MAKIVNPNQINDMEMVNMKNQAKMQNTLMKLGRGRRKNEIFLSKASQKYIDQMMTELKKQMAIYQKQMPNVMAFFDYIISQVHVEKRTKREKYKKIMLSYEEKDFLELQLKSTILEIDKLRKNLKWYNIFKKLAYSTTKKQNEMLLQEVKGK